MSPCPGVGPRLRGARAPLFFVLLLSATVASAHPLGASSVDRFLYFQYTGGGTFRVAYRLDFAEDAAQPELAALDEDHDGKVTPEEQRRYLDSRLPRFIDAWTVEVNGARTTPTIVASGLDVVPGQGDVPTLRIDAELRVEGPPAGASDDEALHVRDGTRFGRPGWRTLEAGEGEGSIAPSLVDGGAARATPQVDEARFTFHARPRDAPVVARRGWVVAGGVAIVVMCGVAFAAWARRRR